MLLGHDFYEGVFAYDVQHYLDFVINKEKLISADEFNAKLKNIRLSERDAKNRPKYFKTRAANSKYQGNAGSLRVLSRILVIILSDILEESMTLKYLVQLHEVGEIITAPKLTVGEIHDVMSAIIEDYLDLCKLGVEELGMPRPRPKHHFLSHYPLMYLNNGPLIGVWGMRMESKHCFCKSVLKNSKNFKNVALTCATRHQMALISHYYFGLFVSNMFELPDASITVEDVLKMVTDPNLRCFYQSIEAKSLSVKKLKIYGTEYSVGKLIILRKESYGQLTVGIISAIAFYKNVVKFAVSSYEALQSKYGYYVSSRSIAPYEVVTYDMLWDYHPLELYGNLKSFSFVLHHFVSLN